MPRLLPLLLFCGLLSAAELDGPWLGEFVTPWGIKRPAVYEIKTVGGTLTGSVLTPNVRFPVMDGVVTGDRFQFRSDFNNRAVVISGLLLSSGELEIQQPAAWGQPAHTSKAVRLTAANRPDFAQPLPPVTLPAVRDLPPNGRALRPPMGWNSWNKFNARIDDKTVREIADALVSTGLRDAGYTYLNIDDGWTNGRDAHGNLKPNDKFPDMKALADYVHSKGLKLGIYSSPGPKTCAQFAGSYGHEEQDAKQFAAWGIDLLKYDWCSASRAYTMAQQRAAYQKMAEALRATGRPIVYSICQYGANNVGEWGRKAGGNLWRTTNDIGDNWKEMESIGFQQDAWAKYAGPGGWNDPDMLEVGNGGMTDTEYRTHFSLWALLAAPLFAGNDIRNMTPATKDILLNKEVIAVNQDALGKAGYRVKQDGPAEVWVKPLQGGAYAVGLFNRGTSEAAIKYQFADLKLRGKRKLRDLWQHKPLPNANQITATVPPHGVVLVRVQ